MTRHSGGSGERLFVAATHLDALRGRHSLHGRHRSHTGHTGHRGCREVSSAVGAKRPAQFEQALALGAGALELLAAGWANLEIGLDARMAVIARLPLRHLGQQRLLFQLPLVNLGQSLARAQDQVNEETTDKEDSHQHSGENLRQKILRTRTDIAERPYNQAQPEDDDKGDGKSDDNT